MPQEQSLTTYVRVPSKSTVTENRYGGVVFDGVCSDTSNAAYPVDEVRRAVEPSFEPPWTDAAIHLGLTLLHHGYVRRSTDGFSLSDEADAMDADALIADICETVEPRVLDGEKVSQAGQAAAFVGFVRDVVDALADEHTDDIFTDREGKV